MFNIVWWVMIKSHYANVIPLQMSVIPLGLGFYTLRTIGYLIDVYCYRQNRPYSFIDYFLYVGFFAHLQAGPVTSWKWFAAAIDAIKHRTLKSDWTVGYYLFAMGLFRKLLADLIAVGVDPALDNVDGLGFVDSWLLLVSYSLQIYFDFSGYTDMAIGSGMLVGIRLPPNFDAPYSKRNPVEFWNAWHITFSHWLRDFIFMPLGRILFSIRQLKRTPLVIAGICYLTTFCVCGLWHGFEVTYLFWGIYHGVGLIAFKIYDGLSRKHFSLSYHSFMRNSPSGQRLAVTSTFVFVSFGWVFFRSSSMNQAIAWIRGLAGQNGFSIEDANSYLIQILIAILVMRLFYYRTNWQPETLQYWQKLVLNSALWVILFYYFVSDSIKAAPFIYNIF